jgi:CubicO group peptidase (beta-lactamase class C family)
VAVVAYSMASAGIINLDQPIVSFVPTFSVSTVYVVSGIAECSHLIIMQVIDPIDQYNGTDITFRHLLSQMSGLQREVPYGVNDTPSALAAIAQTYLVYPAGTAPSYSNLGYALLGHILGEYVSPSVRLPRTFAQ